MGRRRPFQEGMPPPTFCKLCLLGFRLRNSQQPGSVLTSSSQVPSNCLGLTGGGGHRPRQEGPAQDDTADQAAAGPATGCSASVPRPVHTWDGWSPSCTPLFPPQHLALGASGSSQGCPAQRRPPGGQQEDKDRAPPRPSPARALLPLHTILMQLTVPLEIDSHQALMDLSNPLFSLIIPSLGRY